MRPVCTGRAKPLEIAFLLTLCSSGAKKASSFLRIFVATRLFHPPEEVYPAELRGIMLIENTSRSVRRAPEEHNKK